MCVGTLAAVYTADTAGICIQVSAGTGTDTGFCTGTGRFGEFGAGTGNLGEFGTTSIPEPETSANSGTTLMPVPKTSESSVHQYRYRKLPKVRYINTGTENFGKFGTPPIPVPDSSVNSVRRLYRFRTLW